MEIMTGLKIHCTTLKLFLNIALMLLDQSATIFGYLRIALFAKPSVLLVCLYFPFYTDGAEQDVEPPPRVTTSDVQGTPS